MTRRACRAVSRVAIEVVATAVDAGAARLDGVEVTRTLHQQAPATRVIVLSIYATFRSQALADGACRFLFKDCGRDALVAAIRLAAHGQCQINGAEALDCVAWQDQ